MCSQQLTFGMDQNHQHQSYTDEQGFFFFYPFLSTFTEQNRRRGINEKKKVITRERKADRSRMPSTMPDV